MEITSYSGFTLDVCSESVFLKLFLKNTYPKNTISNFLILQITCHIFFKVFSKICQITNFLLKTLFRQKRFLKSLSNKFGIGYLYKTFLPKPEHIWI